MISIDCGVFDKGGFDPETVKIFFRAQHDSKVDTRICEARIDNKGFVIVDAPFVGDEYLARDFECDPLNVFEIGTVMHPHIDGDGEFFLGIATFK